ncbi:DUF3078 domain-containing protein [candidate division KSB1 bacterium]
MSFKLLIVILLIYGLVPGLLNAQNTVQDSLPSVIYTDTLFSRHDDWSGACKIHEIKDDAVTVVFPGQNEPVDFAITSIEKIKRTDGRFIAYDDSGRVSEEKTFSDPLRVIEVMPTGQIKLENNENITLLGVNFSIPKDEFGKFIFESGISFMKSTLENRVVTLQNDRRWRDDKGIRKEYVILENGNVINIDIIQQGFFEYDDTGVNRYPGGFTASENTAKDQTRGLWIKLLVPVETPPPETPSKWNIKNLRPSLTFDQTYLDNWLKGGNDAFALRMKFDGDFVRSESWSKWDNRIDLKYAFSSIGKGEPPQITWNEIKIRSDFIIVKRKIFNPFFGCGIQTQITTGYSYPKNGPKTPRSTFWDPVKLTYRYGVDVSLFENIDIRFSADITEDLGDKYVKEAKIDNRRTEKIEKRKTTRKMSSYIKYDRKFKDNAVQIKTTLNLKSAFKHYSYTVIDFSNNLSFRLIKYVSFEVDSYFKYDITKSNRGQFQNITALVLSYDFMELFAN